MFKKKKKKITVFLVVVQFDNRDYFSQVKLKINSILCVCVQEKRGMLNNKYNLTECHDCKGTQTAVTQQNQSHLAATIWK